MIEAAAVIEAAAALDIRFVSHSLLYFCSEIRYTSECAIVVLLCVRSNWHQISIAMSSEFSIEVHVTDDGVLEFSCDHDEVKYLGTDITLLPGWGRELVDQHSESTIERLASRGARMSYLDNTIRVKFSIDFFHRLRDFNATLKRVIPDGHQLAYELKVLRARVKDLAEEVELNYNLQGPSLYTPNLVFFENRDAFHITSAQLKSFAMEMYPDCPKDPCVLDSWLLDKGDRVYMDYMACVRHLSLHHPYWSDELCASGGYGPGTWRVSVSATPSGCVLGQFTPIQGGHPFWLVKDPTSSSLSSIPKERCEELGLQ